MPSRIGLISDIHGNTLALEVVLAALDAAEVDQILCLGDVAVMGPDPCGVIACLRAINATYIQGNTDAWALAPHPHPVRNADTRSINAIELWSAAQLGAEDRAFLQTFVPTTTVTIDQTTLIGYHGSPRSFHEGIFATTPDHDLDAIFSGIGVSIGLGGHTHTQMVRRYADLLLINPGSVGAPFVYARGSNQVVYPAWAEYGVLEIEGKDVRVELRRTAVDVDAILALAHTHGMPEVTWWSQRWLRDRPTP